MSATRHGAQQEFERRRWHAGCKAEPEGIPAHAMAKVDRVVFKATSRVAGAKHGDHSCDFADRARSVERRG